MYSIFVKMAAMLALFSTLIAASCSNDGRGGEDPWDYLPEAYRDYDEVQALATTLKATYPSIVEVLSLGTTVGGRTISAIVISDNPANAAEGEPRIRLTGGVHGNEIISVEVMLHFVEHLVSSYASDAAVKSLVDDNYIVVIPVLNPDGYAVTSRRNANGIDLNRNCSVLHDTDDDGTAEEYFDAGGDHGSGPFSELETQALKSFSEANIFHLSATFHSGAIVVNVPFDFADDSTTATTPVEYDTVNQFGRTYGIAGDPPFQDQTNYLMYADEYGVVNGADWYVVYGSIQDWSYLSTGALDITVELANSSPSTAEGIDEFYAFNEAALMDYITAASRGISGTVKDSEGNPLSDVSVYVKDANLDEEDGDQKGDLVTKTDSTGWYHKLYYPLDYGTGKTLTLVFERDDYVTREVTADPLTSGSSSAVLDVTLNLETAP